MCALAPDRSAVCRRQLHHCCILVHRFDVVCKSCGHGCEVSQRYVRRHQAGGCSLFYFGADCRSDCCDDLVSMVSSGIACGGEECGGEGEGVIDMTCTHVFVSAIVRSSSDNLCS